MRRWTCALLAVVPCTPGLLGAQADHVVRRYDATSYEPAARTAPSYNVASWRRTTVSWGRTTVHWGKWLVAGGAVAFTVMGAHEHASSNRDFRTLLSMCRANNADCLLGPDGRYVNPAAEQLYQSSIHFDRRARVRLLAGQATLLVAAGLFIADLAHHASGPGNKPFSPLEVGVDERTGGARVGVRLTF